MWDSLARIASFCLIIALLILLSSGDASSDISSSDSMHLSISFASSSCGTISSESERMIGISGSSPLRNDRTLFASRRSNATCISCFIERHPPFLASPATLLRSWIPSVGSAPLCTIRSTASVVDLKSSVISLISPPGESFFAMSLDISQPVSPIRSSFILLYSNTCKAFLFIYSLVSFSISLLSWMFSIWRSKIEFSYSEHFFSSSLYLVSSSLVCSLSLSRFSFDCM